MPKIIKIGCADMGMKDACTQNNVFEKRYWHLTKKQKNFVKDFFIYPQYIHTFSEHLQSNNVNFSCFYTVDCKKKKLNILESLQLHVDIVWELSDTIFLWECMKW